MFVAGKLLKHAETNSILYNEQILCKKVGHDIDPVNNITQVSCLKVSMRSYFTE